MRHGGTQKNCRYFQEEEEAAKAYDENAKRLVPKATRILNFLPDGSLNPGRKEGLARFK